MAARAGDAGGAGGRCRRRFRGGARGDAQGAPPHHAGRLGLRRPHRALRQAPARRAPNGGAPYGAWHDTIMAVEGPAAAAIGELARTRWHEAGGEALEPVRCNNDCWPASLAAPFRDVSVAISRSRPGNGTATGTG